MGRDKQHIRLLSNNMIFINGGSAAGYVGVGAALNATAGVGHANYALGLAGHLLVTIVNIYWAIVGGKILVCGVREHTSKHRFGKPWKL